MSAITLKLLPIALAYIMLTLGMQLTLADFKAVGRFPKAFLLGIVNQMLLLPLVAFAFIWLWQPEPAIAFGILLLSFCAGGITSNLFSYYARGNVALSVTLTGVVSLLSIVSLPILINLSYTHLLNTQAGNVNLGKMGVAVFTLTTLPVFIGMLLRYQFPRFIGKYQTSFAKVASLFFILILIITISSHFQVLTQQFSQIGGLLMAMVACLLLLGTVSGRLFNLSWQDAKTIAIETGIQNGATAIALAPIISGSIATHQAALPIIAYPAITYGILMNVVVIPYILWVRNKN